jgi:hypothetical protein
VRDDVDQAKDVLKTFGKIKGAGEEKGLAEHAYHLFITKDGAKVEWVIARAGKVVMGIGDEEYAVKPGMSPADRDKLFLSREEKVTRLRALLK